MGKRQAQSREFWEGELAFIQGEAAKVSPMGGFHTYVPMQARFCEADGFADLAAAIRAFAPSGAGCDETSHYKAGG